MCQIFPLHELSEVACCIKIYTYVSVWRICLFSSGSDEKQGVKSLSMNFMRINCHQGAEKILYKKGKRVKCVSKLKHYESIIKAYFPEKKTYQLCECRISRYIVV